MTIFWIHESLVLKNWVKIIYFFSCYLGGGRLKKQGHCGEGNLLTQIAYKNLNPRKAHFSPIILHFVIYWLLYCCLILIDDEFQCNFACILVSLDHASVGSRLYPFVIFGVLR
uniref:Uncharacterized protein n=1 Tax=Opuntia streptacantha TaxID=393608 RepID=A0A7C8YXK9_OPUST